jgi:hypothetical protein
MRTEKRNAQNARQKLGNGQNVGELLAGGNWNNGTNCGSRSRNANNYRWNTNTNISAQFATRIQGYYELNSLAGSLSMSGRP